MALQQVFNYHQLVHATSGATGGISSVLLLFPLNNIPLLLQVDESLNDGNIMQVGMRIAERDGIGALYQGWWGSSICVGASTFVYFYAYNALKAAHQIVVPSAVREASPATSLAMAAVAGVVNVLMTAPLWTAGTRLAIQRPTKDNAELPGFAGCLAKIAREDGIRALWKGLGPSLLLVSNPAIQFVTYERLRIVAERLGKARGRKKISSLEFFIMGALAKANATIFTYPLQIAQTQLRVARREELSDESGHRALKYKGLVDCLRKIWAKEGVLGWYKGISAKMWQSVLTSAFQFLTYEHLHRLVFKALKPQ